ncbi:DNA mismatch repair endonuclease MutL [Aminicella lysinilytica]|uniref:DNA mismatch repair protein MutL n=1 Tax=Aminicella lysinilytica TaxID=433323 RepID=A0A4R6Q8E0_9FIRM|nr:DNA mismatch repair endonuclease MutL [Aminicella lysinilytica]TDP58521.1 DNA mismatch repair protein MutL [Aminicella lysinilytica]
MIRVLEKNISDKIAAGEVIERPVSIVKELLENSIDSGADTISVEIKNGGKTFIRVTDNGCGIEADQVETAFLRHATSKIETVADLTSISSLGFRGEALASVAAVTQTTLITRPEAEKTGRRLLINGSEVVENVPVGCPHGTTIIVTDLFYNTPARRQFLKSDSAESGMIIDLMSEMALAYTDIKIQFINNGNVLFATAGDSSLKKTIMTVYRQREYDDLADVDFTTPGFTVTGCISRPSLSRSTRRDQIFFVNGRIVKSKVIEKGLSEAYKERLFKGRYPVAFLFLETDPASVDVNIHPNKKEVRFHDDKAVELAVKEAVIDALGTKEAMAGAADYFIKQSNAEKAKDKPTPEQVDIKQILSSKRETSEVSDNIVKSERSVPQAEAAPQEMTSKSHILVEETKLKPFDFNNLTITGCIFDTYITAVDGEDFYMIDQHAAHERIFYEKLVGQYGADEKVRQMILTPFTVDVPLSVKENQYDWLDSLRDMGYLIEEFGPNSYIVKEIPDFMEISEAENFVKDYIENVSERDDLGNTVVIDKLITRSCKSAVKAHDHLSAAEIQALIDQLKLCRNPFSCPHGRPTFIRFSIYDIEKMFKRV